MQPSDPKISASQERGTTERSVREPQRPYDSSYIPVEMLEDSLLMTPLQRVQFHQGALDLRLLLAEAGKRAGLNPNP
ncbi:hypothetical protein MCEMSE15_00906 [Fimbriimonadaceae bacterium]